MKLEASLRIDDVYQGPYEIEGVTEEAIRFLNKNGYEAEIRTDENKIEAVIDIIDEYADLVSCHYVSNFQEQVAEKINSMVNDLMKDE